MTEVKWREEYGFGKKEIIVMEMKKIIDEFNWAKIENKTMTAQERNTLSTQVDKWISRSLFNEGNFSKTNRYPFYICCDGDIPKEFRTITGFRPKTRIFYCNYCELEMLRIAYSLNLNMEKMMPVYENTKLRIKTNCFGRFCSTGECFETSIAVLRFLTMVYVNETDWIEMYLQNITQTILSNVKKISPYTKLYFLQTLCEIDTESAEKKVTELASAVLQLSSGICRCPSTYKDINGQIIKNCMSVLKDKKLS